MDLRQYNPAMARWVIQDPVVHHDYSPYSAFDNNPVYWSDLSGADSKPPVNLSFQGDEAVQWIFNILVSIGTYTDKHDEKAVLHGFDSFEDFINTVGKTNTESDANNDGSADGGGDGGPKKSKQIKELQEYYKHQQTIQEWENLGIWDDSVTYNNWFHAVGSYFTLVMPTARFNGLFNFFSRESFTVNPSKFDYFFGKITTGSIHNIQRSAQNLKDLNTLGITSEKQLMKVFSQAFKRGSVVMSKTDDWGTLIVKSIKIKNLGAINVSFFYKGGNMDAIPSVTTIIPKIY